MEMYDVRPKRFNRQISRLQLIFFFSLQHAEKLAEKVESFLHPIRPDPLYVRHYWHPHCLYFQKHHPLASTGCFE